jgi:spoIIIJ-associated protein
MKKVEAPTLEAAYAEASKVLECSISELQYEVVQHPSKGILGFMKRNAIIVATCKLSRATLKDDKKEYTDEYMRVPAVEERTADRIIEVLKEETIVEEIVVQETIVGKTVVEKIAEKDVVLDSFFESGKEVTTKENIEKDNSEEEYEEESIVYDELANMIEGQLKELLSHSCFEIDIVEVDVRDNTALIFIDGNDAALLIGKEGYRYNALSYMLFNWLHTKYELFIKLEIAEFLTTQQEMIRSYIKPVIENVVKNGKGKTRFLDGILVQIALEQLRERFPDKYVAVKTSREGKKFVVINEFNNSKSHA